MTTYAVTGSTGPFGRLAIQGLLDRGVSAGDIVAVARDAEKAADLGSRGIEVRIADYTQPETLPAALAGVEVLVFVSGSEAGQRLPQHTAVVDAAQAAGVRRVVYTSILRADTSESPLAPEHKATEELLRDSGIASTFLRNSWYTENYTRQLAQYLDSGVVLDAAVDGRVSAATRADYAEVAAVVATTDGHDGVAYELGGPAFTMAELAATITEVTGTEVVEKQVSPEELVATLQQAGLDAGTAGFVAALDESTARGDLHTTSDDLARLLGRPATTLAEALRASR